MAPAPVERRLAAIVAADVAGYSRLMGADEEGTHAAWKSHRELIDARIAEYEGRIVKHTGDGFLAEFPSVVNAVACAATVQRGMRERNARVPQDRRIEMRIGINLGDVIVEDSDVFGDGVNVAARLEQIAEPGGICLSDDAWRQVRGKLDAAVEDIGERQLKNIERPVRVFRIDVGRPAGAALPANRWPGVRRTLAAAVAGLVVVATAGIWYASDRRPGEQPATDAAGPIAAHAFPMLAVLPFANQTGDPSQDYFSNGVTEEVINALGRFNTLRVIGRNAVLPYKDRPATRDEILSDLGANYLVEGSVRRADQRVRIAVQLTDGPSGTVLWTDRYEGEVTDLFDFEDAIAQQVAGKLAASITQVEGRRSRERPSQDAHDLVLQARALGFGASRADNRRFREMLTSAIEMDPRYAAAHALLAEGLYAHVILGWSAFPHDDLERVKALARRAIALAPDEPDGYRALGRILVVRTEYDQARDSLLRAIEINPSDAQALAVWGTVQTFLGDIEDGIGSLELALRYDPGIEPNHVFDLSLGYYMAHRHDDALRVAEQGLARFPQFAMFNVSAAAAAARLGPTEDAARYAEEVRRRLPFLDLDRLGSRFRDPAHAEYLRDGLRQAGL